MARKIFVLESILNSYGHTLNSSCINDILIQNTFEDPQI